MRVITEKMGLDKLVHCVSSPVDNNTNCHNDHCH